MRGFTLMMALIAVLLNSCSGPPDSPGAGTDRTPDTPTNPRLITPEPFVPPTIEGFSFPLDEATIASWTEDLKGTGGDRIALHAWGLWTGLTALTRQTWNGQRLRTYETWDTPSALNCATTPDDCPATPRPLTAPGQLRDSPNNLAVTVSYDPSASDYILGNRLIDRDTLNGLQGPGTAIGRVVLPDTAIAIKPTYIVVANSPRYALMKTWPGPPDEPQAWGANLWPTCVWVDLEDPDVDYGPFVPAENSPGDPVCTGDEPASPDNIVPLGAFIHFTLDPEEAARATNAGANAAQGDIAILVAMHVTSRESTERLTRWTWQSFWWSTNADTPFAPSTETMASQQPELLRAQNQQAANYAGCAAYQMLDPVQPKTGGQSAGVPVLCYNPHLEAGFNNTTDLPFTSETSGWNDGGTHYAPQFGVESTCMSCHLHAAWKDGQAYAQSDPVGTASTCEDKGCYDATVYVDMEATYLQGSATTDALWSIPDSVP